MKCPRCRTENPQGTRFCGQCGAPLDAAESSHFPSLPKEGAVARWQTMSLPLRELASGAVFAGRYEVIEELGRGGMGRVYKVLDREVREKLALKLLNPEVAGDERTIERFRNELKLARQISHRHVCRMYDLGRDEGSYYITMEYVPGEDLKSFIHRVGQLPAGKAASIARQVGEGLAEAHRLGIVHRDLKPQNIMIDRDGQAKVMDFGIARSVKARGLTGAGVIVGTPEYMSPEQVDGKEPDQRSDVYALGLVLYEMVTGRLPFEGETPLATAVKQKTDAPPDPKKYNPQLPDELRRVILKCLDKSRDKRYRTADDLASDLAALEAALPRTTTPLPVRKPVTSRQITVQFTLKKLFVPALVLVVLAAAFTVWQLIPRRPADRPSLAVFGFKNQTGDASYDYLQEAIPNLLITSLEQSGRFRVTSWERLSDLLRQSGGAGAGVLDEETGFELCRRDDIEIAVIGSVVKAGDMFATDIKILEASTKKLLKSAGARGQGVDSILRSQIDELSRAVSRNIARLPLKLEKPQPKVMDLTTTSMEAYNYFIRGREEYENFNTLKSKEYLEKAIALDPTFAVAYLYLSRAYARLGETNSQRASLQKSKESAGKTTEKERLFIEAQYAGVMENDAEKKLLILSELTEKYPQEKFAHYELGRSYRTANQFAESVQELEKALALDPSFGPALNAIGYSYRESGELEKSEAAFIRYISANPGDPNPHDSLAELYLFMGRFDKAEEEYKEALDIQPNYIESCSGLAYLFGVKENYEEMEHMLNEFVKRTTAAHKRDGLWLVSFYDYLRGRLEKSLEGYLHQKAAASIASPYWEAFASWIMVFIYCDLGRFDEARNASQIVIDYMQRIIPLAEIPAYRELLHGWLDFKRGRLDEARIRLANAQPILAKIKQPKNRSMQTCFYQLLDAEVALTGESPEKALAVAQKVKLLDFPGISWDYLATYNIPYSQDVLARAYWKMGDLERASAEYRRLMNIPPKSKTRYLIHPLYHYRLGRILEEKGDRPGASAEYRKFLELWKDADKALPEPADARKRLAAL